MANAVCHDGYCEPTLNREDSLNTTFGDRAIIGVAVLAALVFSALIWYETSHGIYINPAFFG